MKVMVAVDASEAAEKAFLYYMNKIHKPENEVFIVHEAEKPHLPNCEYSNKDATKGAEGDIKELMDKHHHDCCQIEKVYQEKCKTYDNLNYKVVVDTTPSKIGHGLVRRAESLQADMIVIGTHGHGVLRRTLLGSVSDYVLHHSKIPVMICH